MQQAIIDEHIFIMCEDIDTFALRESLHDGMLVIPTFVLLISLPSLPHLALSKWNLSSFSSLSRGLQYNAHVSSPASENISSGTSQLLPSLANIALNVALFAKP